MARIKKGDTVKILTGKDKGKRGKVIHILPKENKAAVEAINIYKKHSRPKRQGEKGEIVQVVRPLNLSNVMLVCLKCDKATKTGHRFEGGKKIRFCKHCKAEI